MGTRGWMGSRSSVRRRRWRHEAMVWYHMHEGESRIDQPRGERTGWHATNRIICARRCNRIAHSRSKLDQRDDSGGIRHVLRTSRSICAAQQQAQWHDSATSRTTLVRRKRIYSLLECTLRHSAFRNGTDHGGGLLDQQCARWK